MSNFFITHKKTFLGIIFLVLFGTSVSFATPPTYNTLDPDCLPTDPACSIAFNTSTIAENTNLYFTNARARDAALTLDANYNFMVSGSISSIDNAYSVFIGYGAGVNATNATNAIFFGQGAGANATDVSFSNFIGANTGVGATDASYSNFLGLQAGYLATNAEQSNFFGFNAGSGATNANNSSFIGVNAGSGATNANNSNFFGSGAGQGATNAPYSNFFGQQAGMQAENASYSNFFGAGAGLNAINANNSNFFGFNAGYEAADANHSLFIGKEAGYNAAEASSSVFIGYRSGYQTGTDFGFNGDCDPTAFGECFSSIFIGAHSGYKATNANNSNFIGNRAGQGATSANNSNFFGQQAGYDATNASYSNFFGSQAGATATNATNSNFIGANTGVGATDASYSNFFGNSAGTGATNASLSNLFGYQTGMSFTGNNIGSNNIIIGTNISLPNATANAINIGGVLFGTNAYSTTTGNPSITAVTSGRIGIAKVTPAYTLDVGNSSVSGIVARFQNSSGTCDINPTTTSLSCSSDRNLKKNIQPLHSSLSTILSLTPVSYNWNTESDIDTTHTGFIAQDIEAIIPGLVSTDSATGLKAVNYMGFIPYTIKAIQEMNIQVTSIASLTADTGNTLKSAMIAWFGDVQNGIQSIFAKEGHFEQKICLGTKDNETCITKAQLDMLLQGQSRGGVVAPAPAPSITPDDLVVEVVPEPEITLVETVISEEIPVQ